jgi:hypothetical protein
MTLLQLLSFRYINKDEVDGPEYLSRSDTSIFRHLTTLKLPTYSQLNQHTSSASHHADYTRHHPSARLRRPIQRHSPKLRLLAPVADRLRIGRIPRRPRERTRPSPTLQVRASYSPCPLDPPYHRGSLTTRRAPCSAIPTSAAKSQTSTQTASPSV